MLSNILKREALNKNAKNLQHPPEVICNQVHSAILYIVGTRDFIHLPLGKDAKVCNPLKKLQSRTILT